MRRLRHSERMAQLRAGEFPIRSILVGHVVQRRPERGRIFLQRHVILENHMVAKRLIFANRIGKNHLHFPILQAVLRDFRGADGAPRFQDSISFVR